MINKHTSIAFSILVAAFIVSGTGIAAASPQTDAPTARREVHHGSSSAAQHRSAVPSPTLTKGPEKKKVVNHHRVAPVPKKDAVWRCWVTPLDTTYGGHVTRCEAR